MAKRPLRPCRECKALTRNRAGLCDDHAHIAWERHQGGRSSSQRGYGAAWRRLRVQILQRDNYTCRYNLTHDTPRITSDMEVDHVISKDHGGTDDPANLKAICHDCHKIKTARERSPHLG